jgi:DNA-binding XRE family transcriptional regulator
VLGSFVQEVQVTLDGYLSRKDAPTAEELAKAAGVSYTTIKAVRRGMKVKMYSVAKAISDATGGKVKVEELCE